MEEPIVGVGYSSYKYMNILEQHLVFIQIYEYTGIALGIAADVRAGSLLWKDGTDKRVLPPARQIPE